MYNTGDELITYESIIDKLTINNYDQSPKDHHWLLCDRPKVRVNNLNDS